MARRALDSPDFLPQQERAYTALLANLRALTAAATGTGLVLAGIDDEASTRTVVAGLGEAAALAGIALLVGELFTDRGHRLLRRFPGGDDEDAFAGDEPEKAPPSGRALDLTGSDPAAALARWRGEEGRGHDLLLIAAPPLVHSVDAAWMGRVCDGVVLIVDSERTAREDLLTAVDRVRTAGCTLAGLAVHGARPHLPAWLRRLFSSRRSSPSAAP